MPRDPNRIDPIIEKIVELWRLVPDQRLCQILGNAVRHSTGDADLFYVEDEDLLSGIKVYKIWLEQMAKLK
jgi:hypothetical protein